MARLKLAWLAFLLVVNGPFAFSSERTFTPAIETNAGPVIGEVFPTYRSFKGVPYAAPPIDSLRWQPPVQPAKWEQPLLCTAFGPACPQDLPRSSKVAPETPSAFYGPVGSLSEDCLYLNIWTPRELPSKPCPVFLFFHGGRLREGSGAQECFDGAHFARRGVVVVTVNYRLTVFGFLAHPALTAASAQHTSGNYGLLDSIASLKWVRDNITAFGGDPHNVTVGGEAIAVALMAVPEVKGMFQRAIIDSASMPPSLRLLAIKTGDLASMQQVGVQMMSRIGLAGEAKDALSQMRAEPWQKLLDSVKGSVVYGSGVENDLCVDGVTLKQGPAVSFLQGRQNAVPLIIGTDEYEGTMFEHPFNRDSVEGFRSLFAEIFGPYAKECEAMYPFDTVEEARKQFTRMESDLVMATARFFAGCNSKIQPQTYLYQFRREPKWAKDSWRRAFHGMDQAYAFGTLVPPSEYDEIDRKVSDRMMSYWVQFMKTGDPNRSDLPIWPGYTIADDETFLLDERVSVDKGLRAKQLDVWARWLKEVLEK